MEQGAGAVRPTYSSPAPLANPLLPRCYRLVAALQPLPRMIAAMFVSPHTSGRAAAAAAPKQEAVMGQAIPRQHPAVVLRSHYNHLRALLAVAMIAVVGLTAAVVILANDDDRDTSAGTATQVSAPSPAAGTRYDGGPEEGTRGVAPGRQPGVRYDGGPEEGTAALTQRSAPATFDPNSIDSRPGVRYDGGPEEGSRGIVSAQPRVTEDQAFPGLAREATGAQPDGRRYDGGPEEGSWRSGH
jgi:hypothetical protein